MKDTNQIKIAVIIVGFNSRKYLKECFESTLKALKKKGIIIFIDNCSTDDSLEWTAKNYPKIILINSKKNLGFAEANNVAVRKAINLHCQYLLLLNPDTVIHPESISKLIKSADNETILQPLILLHKNGQPTYKINTYGNIIHYLGFSYVGGYKLDYRNVQFDIDLSVASGAAMWIPVRIIKKIGLFDKGFFMYHEDLDFSWRSRLAGFKIRLISDSLVWHKYSYGRNLNKYYYAERNRIIFMLKNYQIRTLVLISPMFLLNELLINFHAIISGYFKYKLQSYLSVIRYLPVIWNFRINKKANTKFDRDLIRYFSCQLDFSEMNIAGISFYNRILCWYWVLVRNIV